MRVLNQRELVVLKEMVEMVDIDTLNINLDHDGLGSTDLDELQRLHNRLVAMERGLES